MSLARHAAIFVRSIQIIVALGMLALQPARADDAGTAEVVVDLFIKAGEAAGLKIGPQEGKLVKEIVKCGLSGKDVGDCVRSSAIAEAIKQTGGNEMTMTAACLASGSPITACGGEALIRKLPAEVQPMVSCMALGSGRIADCTAKLGEGLILAKLPEQFQPAAVCALEGGSAKECGTLLSIEVTKALPESIRVHADAIVTCLGSSAPAVSCMATQYAPEPLKPLIGCATRPGATPQGCAAEFAVQQLPEELRGRASEIIACLNSSQAAGCLATAVAPQEIKGLVGCATTPGAKVEQCAGTFAAQQLPPGAPQMAGEIAAACLGAPDFYKCVEEKGIKNGADLAASKLTPEAKKALQEAMATLDKLRPDAPVTIDASGRDAKFATLKNIMMVAEGIEEGEWGKVVEGAGPELIKIAANFILSYFFTPAVASVLGPVVGALVHNDVNAAKLLLDRIANGDPVGMAEVAFTHAASQIIAAPCSLLPDGKVTDSVCGSLSDAVKFIAEAGSDVAKALLGAGKSVLEFLGVWELVDGVATFVWNGLKDVVNAIGDLLGLGGDEDEWKPAAYCPQVPIFGQGSLAERVKKAMQDHTQAYFANNYLGTCLAKATGAMASAGSVNTAELDKQCTEHFNGCYAPQHRGIVGQICGSMSGSLKKLAGEVSDGIKTAADAYTNMGGPAFTVNELYQQAVKEKYSFGSHDFCDPKFWEGGATQLAAQKCSAYVSKQFPLPAYPIGGGAPFCPALATAAQPASKSCFDSVNANSSKYALVGPNSEFCNWQREAEARNPCKVIRTGEKTFQDGGREVKLPTFEQRCSERVIFKDPWFGSGGRTVAILGTGKNEPGWKGTFDSSGGIYLNDGRTATTYDRGKWLEPPLVDGGGRLKPFIGGNSSGSNQVYRQTEEDKKPAASAPVKPRPTSTASKPFVGSSGSNTSRQPVGNSAMDRLTGDGRSVYVPSASRVPDGNRPRPLGGGSSSGTNLAAPTPVAPGGASGGASTLRPNPASSGLGSSGSNTSRPMQAPTRSGPDQNFSFGAGSGSGRPSGATINPR